MSQAHEQFLIPCVDGGVQQRRPLSTYLAGLSPAARAWPVVQVQQQLAQRSMPVVVASSCLPDPLSFLPRRLINSRSNLCCCHSAIRSFSSKVGGHGSLPPSPPPPFRLTCLGCCCCGKILLSSSFFSSFPSDVSSPAPDGDAHLLCRVPSYGRRRVMGKPPPSSSMPRRTATFGTSKPTTRYRTKIPHSSSL